MSNARFVDKWFLAITGVGVGVRLLFLLAAGHIEPYADESGYIYLAVCWNHFGFFSDGGNYLWPPGYPFFLATMFDWFGVNGVYAAKLVQILASGVIGYSLMLIARRVLDHRAGVVAGLIWCFYVPLIGFTHYLWPETIFLVCFMPALYLLVSWSSDAESENSSAAPRLLGAGLLLGVSLLIKESMLYLSLIMAALIAWRLRRVSWLQMVRQSTMFALGVIVIILPWTLRNHGAYGHAVVAASLGENCYRGIFRRYQNFDYPARGLIGMDETGRVRISPERLEVYRNAPLADPSGKPFYARIYGRDHWIYRWFIDRPPETVWEREKSPNVIEQSERNARKALEFIQTHPGYFAAVRVKRLSNWISPTSFFVRHNGLGRYEGLLAQTALRRPLLVAALALPMLVLIGAIPGLIWAMRGSAGGAVLRCTVLYACIPAMLVGMTRHRIAIEPVLIVAAAGFFSRMGRPRNVNVLPMALIVLGWGLLAFLWVLAAREVTAVAALVWRG